MGIKHPILLISKFADVWGKDEFDRNVLELDKQIATIDTKVIIDNVSDVICVESSKIVPLKHYENPAPLIAPFSFLVIIN